MKLSMKKDSSRVNPRPSYSWPFRPGGSKVAYSGLSLGVTPPENLFTSSSSVVGAQAAPHSDRRWFFTALGIAMRMRMVRSISALSAAVSSVPGLKEQQRIERVRFRTDVTMMAKLLRPSQKRLYDV